MKNIAIAFLLGIIFLLVGQKVSAEFQRFSHLDTGNMEGFGYVHVIKDERYKVICYLYDRGISCLTEKEIKESMRSK